MTDHQSLAERVERAEGPDRELDELIGVVAFGLTVKKMSPYEDGRVWQYSHPANRIITAPDRSEKLGPQRSGPREWGRMQGWDVFRFPPFTASIDAAMMLYLEVPERIPSNPRKAVAEALRQRADATH